MQEIRKERGHRWIGGEIEPIYHDSAGARLQHVSVGSFSGDVVALAESR